MRQVARFEPAQRGRDRFGDEVLELEFGKFGAIGREVRGEVAARGTLVDDGHAAFSERRPVHGTPFDDGNDPLDVATPRLRHHIGARRQAGVADRCQQMAAGVAPVLDAEGRRGRHVEIRNRAVRLDLIALVEQYRIAGRERGVGRRGRRAARCFWCGNAVRF